MAGFTGKLAAPAARPGTLKPGAVGVRSVPQVLAVTASAALSAFFGSAMHLAAAVSAAVIRTFTVFRRIIGIFRAAAGPTTFFGRFVPTRFRGRETGGTRWRK